MDIVDAIFVTLSFGGIVSALAMIPVLRAYLAQKRRGGVT